MNRNMNNYCNNKYYLPKHFENMTTNVSTNHE